MLALHLLSERDEDTAMVEDVNKDIQIHIHEHVGPIRERLGRIEGRLDVNEREITLLRQGLDAVKSSIQITKEAIIATFAQHEEEEWERYSRVESNLQSLRNWIIGISLGIASLWAVLEFLIKSGIFVLHGS